MKTLHFHRRGRIVVVEIGAESLVWEGVRWPYTNWTGTRDMFTQLRADNPEVQFLEIAPAGKTLRNRAPKP